VLSRLRSVVTLVVNALVLGVEGENDPEGYCEYGVEVKTGCTTGDAERLDDLRMKESSTMVVPKHALGRVAWDGLQGAGRAATESASAGKPA